MLLGEVNLPYEQQYALFGGEAAAELTMQSDFIGMQRRPGALSRALTH